MMKRVIIDMTMPIIKYINKLQIKLDCLSRGTKLVIIILSFVTALLYPLILLIELLKGG